MPKYILKWVGRVFLIPVVLIAGFIGYITLVDYRPRKVEALTIIGEGLTGNIPDTFNAVIWNIGYCGLGAEQDFFFEGGTGVRPSEEQYGNYRRGVIETLSEFDTVDFVLLQEVDRRSKRSYYEDQAPLIAEEFGNSCYSFALNYHSRFVPKPVGAPYGKCYSGLMSLSHRQPTGAFRRALAADASWPMGLFMLKRCMLELRFPTNDGRELILINLHLSAFDDGNIRRKQMASVAKKALQEYYAGNYVLIGGDWNLEPPADREDSSDSITRNRMTVPEGYPAPGWTWAYDKEVNTNRALDQSYTPGKTSETSIDFFLLSPNIRMLMVRTIDEEFRFSDHNPVFIRVSLLPGFEQPE